MPDQPDITIPVDGTAGPAAAEPVMPNSSVYNCLISTCVWQLRVPPAPVIDEHVLAGIFGPGVMALSALNKHQLHIERKLEDHLETHTVLEFAIEINKLKDLCHGLTDQLAQMTEAYSIAQANLNYGPVRRTNVINPDANNPEG